MRRILLFTLIIISLSLVVNAALPPPPAAPGGFGTTDTTISDTTDVIDTVPLPDPVVEQVLYDPPSVSQLESLMGQGIDIDKITQNVVTKVNQEITRSINEIYPEFVGFIIFVSASLVLSIIIGIINLVMMFYLFKRFPNNNSPKSEPKSFIQPQLNPRLKNYVDQMLAKGFSKESIKTELIKNGYHKEQIEAIL